MDPTSCILRPQLAAGSVRFCLTHLKTEPKYFAEISGFTGNTKRYNRKDGTL
jgi:hypothetical protein